MRFRSIILCVSSLILIFITFSNRSSADPLDNWHVRNNSLGANTLNAVTYGKGVFVAVGSDGAIFTSADGLNWTVRSSDTTVWLSGASHGNGVFVVIGDQGTILTSPDGVNWNKAFSDSSGLPGNIAFGNGTFVVPYEGGTLTSSNGVNWTRIRSYSPGKVAFCDGTFRALGWNDIYDSPDGVTWTAQKMTGLTNCSYECFEDFECGKGTNVMVGVYLAPGFSPSPVAEMILTSSGSNWQQTYYDSADNSREIKAVTYGNGYFVAMSNSGSYPRGLGRIFTSSDGISWTVWQSVIAEWINHIVYGNNTFIAVGSNGTILQSDPLSGNCTATLSSDLSLHVPIINFKGAYLQGDATCQSDAVGSIMCRVISYGAANPSDFSDCQTSTLTSDFKLYVPAGIYNNISYQADFEYVTSTDGHMWFKLVGAAKN